MNKGPIPNLSFLGSLKVCFETIPGDGRGRRQTDNGNSDNKAISVQLSWGLTKLGKIRSTDQMFNQRIKCKINRSRVRLTDQMLDK